MSVAHAQPALQTLVPPPRALSRQYASLPRREYLSAGGARIVILVETKGAQLTLNGHIYNMKQVVPEAPRTCRTDLLRHWPIRGRPLLV